MQDYKLVIENKQYVTAVQLKEFLELDSTYHSPQKQYCLKVMPWYLSYTTNMEGSEKLVRKYEQLGPYIYLTDVHPSVNKQYQQWHSNNKV